MDDSFIDDVRASLAAVTPHDMPKRKPKHIWTPPRNHHALPAMPYTVELATPPNAKMRRIRRRAGNGWAHQVDDVN